MKILAITKVLPMPDRASGDLRFFSLLRFFAASHDVTLCAYKGNEGAFRIADDEYRRYGEQLKSAGVATVDDLFPVLREHKFDIVWFEFFSSGRRFLDDVRYLQPKARIVVDSVDVQFNRLEAKARLTNSEADRERARRVKRKELDIYSRADAVIAVSEPDKEILAGALPGTEVLVLPNVHASSPPRDPENIKSSSLLFVGGFGHEPNIDAMLYFVKDVLPIIRRDAPETTLTIVGSAPPPEIRALEGHGVEVAGFVPDTAPYLATHAISVAPLRYGGGVKGKVGEAMSHGVPVVTTSFGIEGFGLEPDIHVLVGDSAESFARQVVRLLKDPQLRRILGEAGRNFIDARFSQRAVRALTSEVLDRLARIPVKQLPLPARVLHAGKALIEQRLLRRLRDAPR